MAAFTLTTKLEHLGEPIASAAARWPVTVPVPPTAGVVIVHPAGAVSETKVVFAGTGSVSVYAPARLGARVGDRHGVGRGSCPAATGSGESVFVDREIRPMTPPEVAVVSCRSCWPVFGSAVVAGRGRRVAESVVPRTCRC